MKKRFKYHGVMFLRSLSLEEGFSLVNSGEVLINGKEFSRCKGFSLFNHYHATGRAIFCPYCEAHANQWVLTRHKNDKANSPVLELFGETADGHLVMMTRDHIIPKSFYGYDVIENLRPMCELCNHSRGNHMDREAIRFMLLNPGLYDSRRFLTETNNENVQ
jgi:hypothetical protein